MSGRKRRRWHFRDPKFQTFQGKYTPSWGAFVALTFLPLRTPSKSHATLLWLLTQGWKKRLGLEGVVGGGVYFKDCYCQGGTISRICNYLGGNVLIHHTVLKNPAPLWDVCFGKFQAERSYKCLADKQEKTRRYFSTTSKVKERR